MNVRVEPWSKPTKLTENYGSKCAVCNQPMKKAEKSVDASYMEKVGRSFFRVFVKVHARCVGVK